VGFGRRRGAGDAAAGAYAIIGRFVSGRETLTHSAGPHELLPNLGDGRDQAAAA
jgi:hypothetical protein